MAIPRPFPGRLLSPKLAPLQWSDCLPASTASFSVKQGPRIVQASSIPSTSPTDPGVLEVIKCAQTWGASNLLLCGCRYYSSMSKMLAECKYDQDCDCDKDSFSNLTSPYDIGACLMGLLCLTEHSMAVTRF